jgi:hypothetical protein
VVSPPRHNRGELEGASEIPDNVPIQSGTISSNEFASLYSKAKKMELIVATKTEEQAIADAEQAIKYLPKFGFAELVIILQAAASTDVGGLYWLKNENSRVNPGLFEWNTKVSEYIVKSLAT